MNLDEFTGRKDGPFPILVGYSSVLHHCVVVQQQNFIVHDDILSSWTAIADAATKKRIWTETRQVARKDIASYPKLDAKLHELGAVTVKP
jgi:hypothetical protein